MDVICLEEEAFFELVDRVVSHIKQNTCDTTKDWKWVDTDTCMKLLNIKSKTTLQKIRDEGYLRFSQPNAKLILYDKTSIEEYLDHHIQEPF